jgi:hypothetical protein
LLDLKNSGRESQARQAEKGQTGTNEEFNRADWKSTQTKAVTNKTNERSTKKQEE